MAKKITTMILAIVLFSGISYIYLYSFFKESSIESRGSLSESFSPPPSEPVPPLQSNPVNPDSLLGRVLNVLANY